MLERSTVLAQRAAVVAARLAPIPILAMMFDVEEAAVPGILATPDRLTHVQRAMLGSLLVNLAKGDAEVDALGQQLLAAFKAESEEAGVLLRLQFSGASRETIQRDFDAHLASMGGPAVTLAELAKASSLTVDQMIDALADGTA